MFERYTENARRAFSSRAGKLGSSTLIDRYVEHAEDVLEQVLARL